MKFTSFGAASEVTGSAHLLETSSFNILLDCGLFQGRDEWRNQQLFNAANEVDSSRSTFDVDDLDVVVLSHAHIDHCGRLPLLYSQGFRGPVYCTRATSEVAEVMLLDSARLQAEALKRSSLDAGVVDAATEAQKDSVQGVFKLFEPLDYGEWLEASGDLSLRFSNAGHILGSAICEIEVFDEAEKKRIVYTGDLGRCSFGLFGDPNVVDGCDLLVVESTYADQIHAPPDSTRLQFLDTINMTLDESGRVIIPAFSFGRTQMLTSLLSQAIQDGVLPEVPIYVDSPLSKRVTSIYERYPELLAAKIDVADRVTYTASQRESLELNDVSGPVIIISASGMCENGRILHHLKRSINEPENLICLVGYQASGTLGRQLAEGTRTVPILARNFDINCKVVRCDGLSAHADGSDLTWWCRQLGSRGGIGRAFIVHGETVASQSLAAAIRDECDSEPVIPQIGVCFDC